MSETGVSTTEGVRAANMNSPDKSVPLLSIVWRVAGVLLSGIATLVLVDVLLYLNASGVSGVDPRICSIEAVAPSRAEIGRSGSVLRCVRRNVRVALQDVRNHAEAAVRQHPGACRYEGFWYAWRHGRVYRVELAGSGEYAAYWLEAPKRPIGSGSWKYDDGRIHWRHQEEAIFPMAGRVLDESQRGFTLVDFRNERTVFRIAGEQRDDCGVR